MCISENSHKRISDLLKDYCVDFPQRAIAQSLTFSFDSDKERLEHLKGLLTNERSIHLESEIEWIELCEEQGFYVITWTPLPEERGSWSFPLGLDFLYNVETARLEKITPRPSIRILIYLPDELISGDWLIDLLLKAKSEK